MPHTQADPRKRKSRVRTEEQKKQRSDALRRRREQFEAHIINSPINPDRFYRLKYWPVFFGFKQARLHEAINDGLLPRPISISDGSRAKGCFGRTILEWQRKREEAAEQATV
jgi:predicted DNA-binding transcriptional regulator AlpA